MLKKATLSSVKTGISPGGKWNGNRDCEGCVPICTVTYRTPQVIIMVTDLCSAVTCLLTFDTSCCYMYQVQYTGTVITDFFLWCYIGGFGNNVYCSPEFLSRLNNNPIGIDIETALASWKFFPLEISNNFFCKFSPHWNELQCIRKYYHMLNQYFYVIALYVCKLYPLPWTSTYIWKRALLIIIWLYFTLLIVHFLLVIIFSNFCCH